MQIELGERVKTEIVIDWLKRHRKSMEAYTFKEGMPSDIIMENVRLLDAMDLLLNDGYFEAVLDCAEE